MSHGYTSLKSKEAEKEELSDRILCAWLSVDFEKFSNVKQFTEIFPVV